MFCHNSEVQFKQQHLFHHPKSSTLHCICICVLDRSRMEEGSLSDSDSSPQWCGIAMTQNAPGSESESSTPSEPGATVKSLIKSFDTAVKSEGSLPFYSFNLCHLSPVCKYLDVICVVYTVLIRRIELFEFLLKTSLTPLISESSSLTSLKELSGGGELFWLILRR